MQEIWLILNNISALDVVDIVLVAIPFYAMFIVLREARSTVALWGIVSVLVVSFFVYLIAKMANLQATALFYEQFWIVAVLIFIIIFQGELKRAMTNVGRLKIFRAFFPQQIQVVAEVIRAVQTMAQRKIGCIIAIERSNSLMPYVASGTMLDSNISAEMIGSVFTPYSPLHDGALLVSGSRLVAASCILPLSENTSLSSELGTRHRAAIGLSEETDALVVVVSEETGIISIAEEGKIERHLELDDLRRRLKRELDLDAEEEK